MIAKTRSKPFVDFVRARHRVWVVRDAGLPKPWTKDPILQSYRFCNAYRELDTVTQWIRHHWSARLSDTPDMWFWMVIARLVNHPPTLALMRMPKNGNDWDHGDFIDMLSYQSRNGHKAFGSAYIVSTNGHTMPKPEYLRDHVLLPLWDRRHEYRPKPLDTLAEFHERLTGANGLGSFMAAQVVADVKNTAGRYGLRTAEDWWTWCAPGPGSMRGLSRVLFGDKDHRFNAARFRVEVEELREHVNTMAINERWKELCAQDIQNCLCEFDKYERVRLGEGKPRQKYAGV